MIKFTFIFIILYWVLAQPKGEKAINKYITFCAILFIAMMGLRNEAIFGDTYGYVTHFKELGSYNVADIFQIKERDPIFWVLSLFVYKLFGGNYTLWLTLIAIGFMAPVTKLVRKYSIDPMYSWLTLFFIGFVLFVMAGLRQTVAMSLTLTGFLILLNDEIRRKKLWFIICIVTATLFHGSSIICLVGLFFKNRSLNWGTIALYAITIALGLFMGSSFLRELTFFISEYDDRYMHYADDMLGSNYTYLLQQVIIVLPSLYFLRKRFKEPLVATLGHFAIIGLLFVSLSPFIAEMFRLSFYFSWANLILFPMAIKTMRKEFSILPTLFLMFFIVYLVFINGFVRLDYYFWFENTSHIIRQFY